MAPGRATQVPYHRALTCFSVILCLVAVTGNALRYWGLGSPHASQAIERHLSRDNGQLQVLQLSYLGGAWLNGSAITSSTVAWAAWLRLAIILCIVQACSCVLLLLLIVSYLYMNYAVACMRESIIERGGGWLKPGFVASMSDTPDSQSADYVSESDWGEKHGSVNSLHRRRDGMSIESVGKLRAPTLSLPKSQVYQTQQICALVITITAIYLLVQYGILILQLTLWLLPDPQQIESLPWMVIVDVVHCAAASWLYLVPLLKYCGLGLVGSATYWKKHGITKPSWQARAWHNIRQHLAVVRRIYHKTSWNRSKGRDEVYFKL